MGLFRSKGRGHTDQAPVEPPADHSTPTFQSQNDPSNPRNDISTVPSALPNQFNSDSGYSGSYTNSNVSSNTSNGDNHSAQKPPRTTIVTTTTTTTTTTTVASDGSTHTQVHPYDPTTDPPPASETTITNPTNPSNNENSNTTADYTTVRRNSTSGGRPIPPRSELRNSRNASPQSPTQAQAQAEYQNQTDYQPQSEYQSQSQYQPEPQYLPSPLASHPLAPLPLSASNGNGTYHNQASNAAYQNQTPDQVYQSSTYPSQTAPSSAYSQTSSDHAHHGKRESLATSIKALHGAGEALRGAVNSKIASRLGDEQDAMHQRMVREQGLREVRETGIRDRVLLSHGGKLRKRSLSRGLAEERRPLERVDESETNF